MRWLFWLILLVIGHSQWHGWNRQANGTIKRFYSLNDDAYIGRLCLMDGNDGIISLGNVLYSNGDSVADMVGGLNGSLSCFYVKNGDCISRIKLKWGEIIESLIFITKEGELSGIYGKDNNDPFMDINSNGRCVTKIAVDFGEYINRISFYFWNITLTIPPTMEPTETTTTPSHIPTGNSDVISFDSPSPETSKLRDIIKLLIIIGIILGLLVICLCIIIVHTHTKKKSQNNTNITMISNTPNSLNIIQVPSNNYSSKK